MARAAIGLFGVGASVGGSVAGFSSLRLLTQDVEMAVSGAGSLFTPMAVYHLVLLAFFLSLLIVGISLIAAAVNGRSEDIVPGPSLYVMGAALLIAAMCQLLFGRPGLAAASAVAGFVLMIAEYRSALL